MRRCSPSGENTRSYTEPLPRVSRSNMCSETKVPSLRKICNRLCVRSHTYTRLSACEMRMQCTGFMNCSNGACAGSYVGVDVDAVLTSRPLVAGARPAPREQEIPRLVEH